MSFICVHLGNRCVVQVQGKNLTESYFVPKYHFQNIIFACYEVQFGCLIFGGSMWLLRHFLIQFYPKVGCLVVPTLRYPHLSTPRFFLIAHLLVFRIL